MNNSQATVVQIAEANFVPFKHQSKYIGIRGEEPGLFNTYSFRMGGTAAAAASGGVPDFIVKILGTQTGIQRLV